MNLTRGSLRFDHQEISSDDDESDAAPARVKRETVSGIVDIIQTVYGYVFFSSSYQ